MKAGMAHLLIVRTYLRTTGEKFVALAVLALLLVFGMKLEPPQDSQFQLRRIHQKVMKSVDDQKLIDPSERWRHPTGEVAKLAQRLQFHLTYAFTRNIQQTADLSQGVTLVAV